MNDAFESPDGVICVVYSDRSPRPRQIFQVDLTKDGLGPQIGDIGLAWYPTYPDVLHRLRPVHPNWIGVVDPAFEPSGIDPVAWLPTYLDYLAAPRLHRAAPRFSFDPLSGDMMNVAIRLSWDPKQKAPLVRRPRLRETMAVFYQPPPQISAGTLTCTAIADVDVTAPALVSQSITRPQLINSSVTVPALIHEGVC